jgi:hypothetical protein
MSRHDRITRPAKQQRQAGAQRRLSAALRENLKRRKVQAKGRTAATGAAEPAAPSHDSAGIDADKRER